MLSFLYIYRNRGNQFAAKIIKNTNATNKIIKLINAALVIINAKHN